MWGLEKKREVRQLEPEAALVKPSGYLSGEMIPSERVQEEVHSNISGHCLQNADYI
jgi:hypothetical protein